MKKRNYYKLLIVAFIIGTILFGCSKYNNISYKDKSPVSLKEKEQVKNTNLKTSYDKSNNEILDLLSSIKYNFNQSGDEKYPENIRKDKYKKFIDGFNKFLLTRESIRWGQKEVTEILGNEVKYITKDMDLQEYNVRIITFYGSTSIISRSNEAWTFVQWWNDSFVYTQMLFEGNSTRINDFCLNSTNSNIIMLMIGTAGKNPTALCRILRDEKWSEFDAFNETKIVERNGWEYYISSSEIVITKRKKNDPQKWIIPSVKINQDSNGFFITSIEENLKEDFILMEGKLLNTY